MIIKSQSEVSELKVTESANASERKSTGKSYGGVKNTNKSTVILHEKPQ